MIQIFSLLRGRFVTHIAVKANSQFDPRGAIWKFFFNKKIRVLIVIFYNLGCKVQALL